ncbi:MAG TPA: DUF4157 domain-containing protein [Anaerolineaceae bacterium]|nr:DUF4157 domain-containing protein [Anaerolineaceae bacterium]HPN51232.1 DUF4157 domain-containing protein [Anaerolineaceae bacterium]
MKYKGSIPEDAAALLISVGVPEEAVRLALVEEGTDMSIRVTKFFNSGATVLGRTIYFRESYYDPTTPAGLGLLAHEVMHVKQTKEAGLLFFPKYGIQFLKLWFQEKQERRRGRSLPQYWVHDEVPFEKEAMEVGRRVELALVDHPRFGGPGHTAV